MADIKLMAPRFRILLADGSVIDDLQAINADLINYETTAAKQKPPWPPMEKSRVLWMTFVAWSAARRTGAIALDFTWDRWRVEAVDVAPQVDEDTATDPTDPGLDPA